VLIEGHLKRPNWGRPFMGGGSMREVAENCCRTHKSGFELKGPGVGLELAGNDSTRIEGGVETRLKFENFLTRWVRQSDRLMMKVSKRRPWSCSTIAHELSLCLFGRSALEVN